MAGIVNILSQAFFHQAPTTPICSVKASAYSAYNNNPFVNLNGNNLENKYAKNQPVRGGYFAGYYNGKQNIVGQRLFIEV